MTPDALRRRGASDTAPGDTLSRLRPHAAPLLLTLALALFPLITLASTHPAIVLSPDSREYLATAARIAHSGQLVDARRTPGYPLLLALLFALVGEQRLGVVVVAQAALAIASVFGVYLLTFRLARQPWVACAAAGLVALNLDMLDWAYSIRDETFSMFLLIALFLVTERIARQPSRANLLGFGLLAALLIFTRPIYALLPALLLLALAVRALGLAGLRQGLRQALRRGGRLLAGLTLAGVLVYGLVAGYAALNRIENGYLGISYVSDVNLFGKVIEYRLFTQPVAPAYQPMQAQLVAFTEQGGNQPWDFATQHRSDGYENNHYAALGAFAHATILRYPMQYALLSLSDAVRVWRAAPGMDAQGAITLPLRIARDLARYDLLTYLALPLVALWLGRLLWRGWRDPALFTAALLLLAALLGIGMTAAASYQEFYRLRAPTDWAYLTVFALVALDAAGAALQLLVRLRDGMAQR